MTFWPGIVITMLTRRFLDWLAVELFGTIGWYWPKPDDVQLVRVDVGDVLEAFDHDDGALRGQLPVVPVRTARDRLVVGVALDIDRVGVRADDSTCDVHDCGSERAQRGRVDAVVRLARDEPDDEATGANCQLDLFDQSRFGQGSAQLLFESPTSDAADFATGRLALGVRGLGPGG